ncbi:MAG: TauD/TfdA dioxygenase family protein [Acidimicrobiales bacterium]
MDLDVSRIAGNIGAEVAGVDLSTELSDDTVDAIRSALVEHHVLVFRDQSLSPEHQVAFGKRFGPLDVHPFVDMNADFPDVIDVITEPDDRYNFGGAWHSDVTFREKPDLGSILYAVDVPEAGGDTLFASQHAAYDELSDTMKDLLRGMTAVHSPEAQYGDGGLSTRSKSVDTTNAELAATTVEHPVVRTHPESGRKALYVNQAFTTRLRGLRAPESRMMLDFLFEHCVKEPFQCRVKWQPGTLVMWDNRSVQHYAVHDYAGSRRHMRRITISGDRPF